MKLIVGLGNPGDKYAKTRHNAGFMAVDYLAKHFGLGMFKDADRFKSKLLEGKINAETTLLMKPQTFMNLSGEAVQSVMHFYKIPVEDLIVIYDDVEIPFGKGRIRSTGSAGGHNGMKSIIQMIGTQEFVRIRIGIQPLESFKGALEDYVLGKITKEQEEEMQSVIQQIPDILDTLAFDGIEKAMNEFN
ncbi:aminoacyl-tRNA hydrolase [Patescibacteria group bacterium]|nr:aminoacyl-tRNA hydrolase [Patescibacteria group bacterium]MBU1683624.1 aminoacyl-tRNA hydrolase [Patescibacteria group bacterium]